MSPEPAMPSSNLPADFLAARRPIIEAVARRVFYGVAIPSDLLPAPRPKAAPVQPPNRFSPGHVPANKLDITDEERAERIKEQKRAWRIAHRSGRPPGRPRKALVTGQGPLLVEDAS